MTNPFMEEIINASHMRLLSPDWEIVENGYNILKTINLRIHDVKLIKKIKTETDAVTKDYNERKNQIDAITDKLGRRRERYLLEFQRLEQMIGFYDKLLKDHPALI